jgi:hypothetical protein
MLLHKTQKWSSTLSKLPQHSWAQVLELKVLVGKPATINGDAARAVVAREVPTLAHELQPIPT